MFKITQLEGETDKEREKLNEISIISLWNSSRKV